MPISVSNQAHVFLLTCIGGMLIGFTYDLFRIKRKALKTNIFFIYIDDLLYWVLVALLMFGIVYYSNEGEIRGYLFIGTILGLVLYMLLLSRFVMGIFLFILRIIRQIFHLFFYILFYPFRIVGKIFAVPIRYAGKKSKRALGGIGRRIRQCMAAKAIRFRKLRNIRKKI